MIVWGATDKGMSRTQNQDYYHLELAEDGSYALTAICDGMGGARAGNIASVLACRTFVTTLVAHLKPGLTPKAVRGALTKAVDAANNEVYTKANQKPEYYGMGTTLVGGVVTPKRAIIVNVGDSRAYLADSNEIKRITRDHSIVEDLITKGELTPEEAKSHPDRNLITRALGTEPEVQCDIFVSELRPGDILLLCSDGLSNVMEDSELFAEVWREQNTDTLCGRLIGICNSRGGPDNITVNILSV
jgi:protein phosphatase